MWFWVFVWCGRLLNNLANSIACFWGSRTMLDTTKRQCEHDCKILLRLHNSLISGLWIEFGSLSSSFLFQAMCVQFIHKTIIHTKEKPQQYFKLFYKKKKITLCPLWKTFSFLSLLLVIKEATTHNCKVIQALSNTIKDKSRKRDVFI